MFKGSTIAYNRGLFYPYKDIPNDENRPQSVLKAFERFILVSMYLDSAK